MQFRLTEIKNDITTRRPNQYTVKPVENIALTIKTMWPSVTGVFIYILGDTCVMHTCTGDLSCILNKNEILE